MKFQRIQDLRVDSDLSQRQLGEILHISQRSYSHYETGSRGIPIEMLIRLADWAGACGGAPAQTATSPGEGTVKSYAQNSLQTPAK